MWRDGRFRWSALIVPALLVAALALGWKNYTTARIEQMRAQAESRESWETQGEINPHSAAHFGVYAFQPKMPLSLVDSRLDNFTGTNVWVKAHYQNPLRGRRDGSRLLAEHYQDHPELMPKSGKADFEDFGLAFVHIQREQKKRVDEVEEKFAIQLARQQNLVKTFRFLWPSVIAREASNDIAGTGLGRFRHFRRQVREFDKEWSDYFVPRIYRRENLTAADFDQIPRFSYHEERISAVASRVGKRSALFEIGKPALIMRFEVVEACA